MAFGNGLDDQDDVLSEINMIPLVDIMLVLLIIFMITVPVMTHSVRLDLPVAQNVQTQVKPETMTVAISKEGNIYWNGQLVNNVELETYLRQVASESVQPEIHIHGDRQVAYEHVAKFMATAQKTGIQKLGFITQPDGR